MLKEGSKEYERKANALARCYVHIVQCKKCGNPRVDGYCCPSCGDAMQEDALESKYAKAGRRS